MPKTCTNMASEFWFFSQLHRLGYEAYITLVNTKAIDIIVKLCNKKILKFDVKGKESCQNGTYQYLPEPPYEPTYYDNHFFVFIGLQIQRKAKNFIVISCDPICYIVEASKLDKIASKWKASKGNGGGYGFNQKILPYLKGNQTKISKKSLTNFKEKHDIKGEILLEEYKDIVMTLQDFENRFHDLKQASTSINRNS